MAIKNLPKPSKQKELLHYLGAINYFRASLGRLPGPPGESSRSAAEILQPLYSLATCNIAKTTKFEEMWSESIDKAFKDSKALLTRAVELNFPDPQAPLALTCDASLVALGATLEQFVKLS